MNSELLRPLEGLGEDARVDIAGRVGARLLLDDIPVAERQAAEALARALSEDAVERVRRHFSMTVRSAARLPRDIAMRIAHDIDSIACPFLEVTEVFSDSDWQQLILTISRGARVAIARRESLPEVAALGLAELGDTVVAETLVENPAAPMSRPVCARLVDRFCEQPWVLDKLAMRDDLVTEIVVELCDKVSSAARQALVDRYDMPDFTEPLAVEADVSVTREMIRQSSEDRLPYLVNALIAQNKLKPPLLLVALGDGALNFFEFALAMILVEPLNSVREVLRYGSAGDVAQMLRRADMPGPLLDDYWQALMHARKLSVTTH